MILKNYLINLNKKVLIISTNRVEFKNYFINRSENVDNFYLTYFNNDIQYGSKYILKRVLDIVISLIALVLLLPLFLFIYIYIGYLDGFPTIIKQNRVGLHGNHFNMYKFRTMKKGSHGDREVLQKKKNDEGPLFKLKMIPRIIKGTNLLRKFSLDELPQFFNV
jgi:lipopolysaccharide/colanic/teichoic acid biosynthesis glycosyltransferase